MGEELFLDAANHGQLEESMQEVVLIVPWLASDRAYPCVLVKNSW